MWSALAIDGDVLLPGDALFDETRMPQEARFRTIVPQAVVRCRSAEDVGQALEFAAHQRIPVAVRSGGHCFAGRSTTEGMLLDVSLMDAVTPDGDTVTVGAGARLGRVYDTLHQHGRTMAAGCGPTVGISGLTLGGGLGVLGRQHGLTSDQLVAATVVLPDRSVVDCSADREPDLFWALRGAGATGFGVVTSLTFRTIPEPDVTAFHLTWPASGAVVDAWQRWSPSAPDELAASLLITASADRPAVAHVFGTMTGNVQELDAQLDRLDAPDAAERRELSFRDAKSYLNRLGDRMHPPTSAVRHAYSKSEFFARPLPLDAAEHLVEQVQQGLAPGEHRELDFNPWGGAYNRVPAERTAFVHRGEDFLLKHGVTVDAGTPPGDWLARSWAIAHEWGTGRAYQNFPDPELPESAYHGANLARVRELRRRYDPGHAP
jgi:FAD/FMN-containing dehydrogenase